MVVTGLGLLFGGRADAGRVRAGAGPGAWSRGRLRLARPLPSPRRSSEAGAELDDDGSLLLSRTVRPRAGPGRTSAAAACRSAMLGEVGEQVVAVHGQSDQLRLLRPAEQRGRAGPRSPAPSTRSCWTPYREAVDRWRAVADDLTERRRNARERAQEADLLRLGLDEITRVDPQPGEDDELRAEVQRLEHAEGLRSPRPAAQAQAALSVDEPRTTPRRHSAARSPRRASSSRRRRPRPGAGRAGRPARGGGHPGRRRRRRLSAYLGVARRRPGPAGAVHERRAALRGADPQVRRRRRRRARLGRRTRRAGCRAGHVRRAARGARHRAPRRARGPARRAGRAADRASAARRRPGGSPTRSRVELAGAGDAATPAVTVDVRGARGEPGRGDGLDDGRRGRAAAAHPGAPPLPLQKGASGGELSRVMLAIEVVLRRRRPAADAWSSTRSTPASAAGPRSRSAGGWPGWPAPPGARGDAPAAGGGVRRPAPAWSPRTPAARSPPAACGRSRTTSGRRELARMLAGLPDSDLGIAHAEELLALAAPRAKRPGTAMTPRRRTVHMPWDELARGARRDRASGCRCSPTLRRTARPSGAGVSRHRPARPAYPALVGRLRPGDIAVIDHVDLDRVAADALVARGVAAVLNAEPSISGRYPNLGPEVLVEAGILLVDERRCGDLRPAPRGRRSASRATRSTRGDQPVADGVRQDDGDGRRGDGRRPRGPVGAARGVRRQHAWSTSSRSATCCSTASACPTSRPASTGRHVLIVVRGYDYKADLDVAAAVHPREQAGADRRRRRRGRAGRGRLHGPT